MAKNSGVSKVSEQFLEQLDNDAKSIDMLSEEDRQEIVKILRKYSPEIRKSIMKLDRRNRDTQFLNHALTMRVLEYKVERATGVLENVFELLDNRSYTKSTKESLHILLKELGTWLNAM